MEVGRLFRTVGAIKLSGHICMEKNYIPIYGVIVAIKLGKKGYSPLAPVVSTPSYVCKQSVIHIAKGYFPYSYACVYLKPCG